LILTKLSLRNEEQEETGAVKSTHQEQYLVALMSEGKAGEGPSRATRGDAPTATVWRRPLSKSRLDAEDNIVPEVL
jgi:hypothetical protein